MWPQSLCVAVAAAFHEFVHYDHPFDLVQIDDLEKQAIAMKESCGSTMVDIISKDGNKCGLRTVNVYSTTITSKQALKHKIFLEKTCKVVLDYQTSIVM